LEMLDKIFFLRRESCRLRVYSLATSVKVVYEGFCIV